MAFSTSGRFKAFKIKTLEGDMRADVGDSIIKGVKGGFSLCKPDIFEATYEEVEDVLCDGNALGEDLRCF